MINKMKNKQITPFNKQNIFILIRRDHHPMVSIVLTWSKLVTQGILITFPKELGTMYCLQKGNLVNYALVSWES